MNRDRPAYRCFDMSDQPDGREFVWCEVNIDNSPGRELTPSEVAALQCWLAIQPWMGAFWERFHQNKKATIYADGEH